MILMRQLTIAPDHAHIERERIRRRDLLNGLLIGVAPGTIILGLPLGWFTHRIYAQRRMAQLLLCRQQNFGLLENQLQARCSNPL